TVAAGVVLVAATVSVVAGVAGAVAGAGWVVSGVLVFEGAVTGSGPETRTWLSLPLHAVSIAMLAAASMTYRRVMY
ncbi:MAG: hypothetical protein ACI9AO_001874, partial [Ilumatobacter sp.]